MSLLDENITECLDDVLVSYEYIEQYLKIYSWYDQSKYPESYLRAMPVHIRYMKKCGKDNSGISIMKLDGFNIRQFRIIEKEDGCHIEFPDIRPGLRIIYLITMNEKFEIPKWLTRMANIDDFAVAILYGMK